MRSAKVEILLALLSGAAVGALVALLQPAWEPALLFVPLVLVIAVASRVPQEPAVEAAATS
ncbi:MULTISPECIES: hypothetical protein [Micromonospora]|uniref:Uncharacterized protein n=1 Tax=Micromonospora sicca TaxID=2202420 RepID=A0A317DH90_9ACTN|nr:MULTISPECIES: hypothetical protein [unclassified Micromonospora]MBM0224490.1 hypothetical protein [Micromonospora sp. ATA51]PWR13560.1 hypothetical protein DKT69_20360 [Micromonospora sp. 4G51]